MDADNEVGLRTAVAEDCILKAIVANADLIKAFREERGVRTNAVLRMALVAAKLLQIISDNRHGINGVDLTAAYGLADQISKATGIAVPEEESSVAAEEREQWIFVTQVAGEISVYVVIGDGFRDCLAKVKECMVPGEKILDSGRAQDEDLFVLSVEAKL